jgi:hypothetical protein
MIMERTKKGVAMIVCFALLLTLIFSVSFVSHGAFHECVGEECHICAVINKCAELLRDLLLSVAGIAIFGILVFSFSSTVNDFRKPFSAFTPVRLKVKLTN